MRRLLLLLTILLLGCSGAPGSSTASSAPSATSGPAASGGLDGSGSPSAGASSAPSGGPSASSAGALPADCAEGFAAYLVEIEPIVSSFDPASATLADLRSADDAVGEKSIELLRANDSRAPYSCSEAGLEWAYFDASSPWDAVLAIAADAAPGTVAYLTALRAWSDVDVTTVGDYGIDGCDAAVTSIKERVAAQTSGNATGVEEMGLDDGLALLGLYHAYMRDVRDEVCPRDALGNDEFDFFGAMG